MKKIIIRVLKALAILILLVVIVGFFTARYFSNTFLSFEDDFVEIKDFKELTVDGYTFLDRNSNGKLDVYEDNRKPISTRVADVLSQMTLEEKIHLLKGSGLASAMGRTEPGEGIAGAVGTIVPTTAFPIGTLLASSWNEELLFEVGSAMGNEAVEYGIDVILGPGANIHRHPLCGRNFEYYSEDPILSGYMGAAMVNGIESNGVGTAVKHFVANNQETERTLNDVKISERAFREIYLKGFEIIVKESQPWMLMSSYNLVNGTYVPESEYILTDILRNDWGFEGMVVTDWFGGKNPPAMISAGNDLLEPGTNRQWKALTEAAENGELAEADIDRAASRILTLVFKSKKMQDYTYNNTPDLKAHAEITRKSAAEGMVLLKNENALPLAKGLNVALLGTTSYSFIAGGTGSGDVNEAYTVSLEEGLTNAGYQVNELAKNAFEAHKIANVEGFKKPEGMDVIFNPFSPPEMNYTTQQLEEIAASSDVGIFTLGRNAGEGGDRKEVDDFLLTAIEQKIVSQATKAFHAEGKKMLVVLNIGGVIETL